MLSQTMTLPAKTPRKSAAARKKTKRTSTTAIGRKGEEVACEELVARGFEIIARNWRCRYGEADLIALDGNVVVLIEVKTRRLIHPDDRLMPEIAVGTAKQKRYGRIASVFMLEHPDVRSVRFDVMGVGLVEGGEAKVHYIKNAFTWDD